MKSENWINEELAELRTIHQFRSIHPLPSSGGIIRGKSCDILNFSSNDYLNFLSRPELKKADRDAVELYGTGSGASRLVTGSLDIHEKLEEAIASHKGYPTALLFGSGFLTNLGVISSVVKKGDLVIADRLVHASILDAIRLSGARLIRFQHNDLDHLSGCLEKSSSFNRTLIVTESIFSMDGDEAPLVEIAGLAANYNAMLMVDEAHATGVYGSKGCGLVAQHNLQQTVNISMCTLSKGLGSYGGAVASSDRMKNWLINNARSFIYTTALPPGVCASAIAAFTILDKEPEMGPELLRRADLFRSLLQSEGFNTGTSSSHIIPVMIGDNERTLKLSEAMRSHHMIVSAIRPPTVPRGTARLRFSITLAHQETDLKHAASTLALCARELGL